MSRSELLEELRALGIERVEARYSGYGDEGYIDEIDFFPSEPGKPMRRNIDDFFWEEIIDQSQHSGFYNNDGGYGTITWDIVTNKITMQHNDYYTETQSYDPEEIQ